MHFICTQLHIDALEVTLLTDRFELWLKGLKPETSKLYGRYANRLFTAMNLTPDEALEKVKQEASVNRSGHLLRSREQVS